MPGKLRVTQVKSTISHIARNRATVRALGLKRIGHTVEIPDNDATRGMVRQVRFLVSVEEVPGTGKDATGSQASLAQGGDEHASERTSVVRERARAGVNARKSRMSPGGEEKS
jgi:large subunit ribosomal protein L30